MTNRIHLITPAAEGPVLENIVRDFKKSTSVMISRAIANNPGESRKGWLLWMFGRAARKSGKHSKKITKIGLSTTKGGGFNPDFCFAP